MTFLTNLHNKLWIGHRTESNQTKLKDPSFLSPEARAVASYPGGHNEGLPDTFKQLYAKVYDCIVTGDFTRKPDYSTFADGHYEMQLCEAIAPGPQEKAQVKLK